MKTRILVIDADSRSVQTTRECLLKEGYEVSVLEEFKNTQFLREVNPPHLILLDILIPEMNGFEVVRMIRAVSQVPIVIMTAKSGVTDRLAGLEAGADDYLAKPFEPRELVLRIQSILRRLPSPRSLISNEGEVRELSFKGLSIQANRRRILLDEQVVELTTAEFDLLRLLAVNSHQIFSRERILDQLRGVEWEAVDRSIDILVSRLRVKLRDDPRNPRFIRTIRSVGYQFVGEISPAMQSQCVSV